MELDEVASEGTAGEESSSGCNSNDQTNQSKTMKERMAEISEEPTAILLCLGSKGILLVKG
jgi:hypothetical protein